MKKVVKLSIEDIEKVVHKVIQEQQEEGTPYILAKGNDGFMYVMNPDTGEVIGRKPL